MKVWKTAECDESQVQQLAGELTLHPAVARSLIVRGHRDAKSIDLFLHPRLSELSDPFLLPGMEAAVARVWRAIDAREKILVFGDYDVDGVSSTALVVQVLARLGAPVTPFLPHRMDDGYGLGVEPLRRCIENHQPKLVITVDCGTSAVEAVEAARAAGVDVIVTDHHESGGVVAPAVAVVNPKLGSDAGARNLAGVGVAFKLCHALLKRARQDQRPEEKSVDLREYLDLIGIGTIADIVPLQDENRILARHGLARLNRTECIGLKSIIRVAGITGALDTYHVGFLIGPRLNAAGRLGDAQAALELLLTQDPVRADELAAQLDAANRERQELEARIVKEAIEEIDAFFDPKRHFGLVVARKGWHAGVIGIVASRLVQKYRRPVVVVALDDEGEGRGSCRSIEGFNLVAKLAECGDLLERYGGHAMAAGLDVRQDRLEAFKEKFNGVAAQALEGTDLRPVVKVDAWVTLDEADERLMSGLEQMRPFGLGNPTPVWAARRLQVVGPPRVVGKKHLKLLVASGATQREAIAFGMGERQVPPGPIDVAFQLQTNSYMGRETLQLNVQDFRASGPEDQ